MILRCEAADCEGWALDPGDRYCPNCGHWQQPVELLTEIQVADQWVTSWVLGSQPARLGVVFRGRGGSLDLSQLRLPEWLQVDPPSQLLEPGGNLWMPLRVGQQPPEGVPGRIGLNEAELEVWCSAPARAELHWSPRLLNPEKSEIEGELRLLEGALYVDCLPAGWQTEVVLPTVLSLRSGATLPVRAPAVEGPIRWQLGSTVVTGQIDCRWAGTFTAPLRQAWCLTRFPELEVPIEARQGPVEIERIICDVAEVEFPGHLEGEGWVRLRAAPELAADQPAEMVIHLSDGRKKSVALDLARPQPVAFPGWLLVDFGGTASGAALVEDQGRLTQLNLEGDSPYLPSGIAYFPDNRRRATDQPGPNVITEAKRNLGRGSFAFRLILPETGEILERTPQQAAQDYFGVLLERIRPQLGLYRVERCCLTHPAAFSPRQVEELRQAWLAQLDCQLECISEPLAAAYFYLSQRSLPPRCWRLLLYDFGGTTSDVAVLQVDSRSRTMVSVEMEHVGGDRWFGGQDISDQVSALLPPEQRRWAETVKRNYGLAEPLPLPSEVQSPARSRLDSEVEPRLRLSLPQPPLQPDLIVLSGRGSHYPLIGEWLQRQFPGVALERCSQPKDCVVLGARLHPEVMRSTGPRSLGQQSSWLHFPESPRQPVCTTRLGIKVMGDQGARFHTMVSLGQPLPCQVELTPLSLLAGPNPVEVVENLGTEAAYVLPDGSDNTQLVLLEHVTLRLERALDPARTRLRWELSADYRLRLTVWDDQAQIAAVGPFSLWPNP